MVESACLQKPRQLVYQFVATCTSTTVCNQLSNVTQQMLNPPWRLQGSGETCAGQAAFLADATVLADVAVGLAKLTVPQVELWLINRILVRLVVFPGLPVRLLAVTTR